MQHVVNQTREHVQSWGEQGRAFPLPNMEADDDPIRSALGESRLREFSGGLYGPGIKVHCCSAMSHSLHIG